MVDAFDAAKYERLMNGLEAVEMKLSEVMRDNIEFRFDTDFFQKKFLENTKFLIGKANKRLLSYLTELKSFGAYSLCNEINFVDNGIPFLRCLNIKSSVVIFDDVLFIDQKSNKLLWKSEIKPNMVLITMSGTVGNTTIALESWDYPINSNQDIAKLLVHDLNPFFLSTFLNSSFGYLQMQRLQAGAIQQHLYLSQIEKLIIPCLSTNFQVRIENIIKLSFTKLDLSKKHYYKAETLLLTELGLHNWQPTQAKTAIKTFNNSFFHSGRLDAEYYQPKYDELTAKIKSVEYDSLQNLVIIKKSIEPGSDAYMEEGVPFIRVSNLSKYGLTAPDIFLYKQQFDNLEKLYLKKDTVLLTKDGSVGIAYKVEEDMDAVTSGAILHLTINNKKIIPDYLVLVLNSVLVQMQAERDAGGSIIQHWRSNEIEQVLIPVINMNKQLEIAGLVQQSFALKKQSAHLLNIAKRAVEMAIEESEEAAMAFIKEQVSSEV